jgi:murein DD-endopeptidase MepM/ murein hydrolase activator NlpD
VTVSAQHSSGIDAPQLPMLQGTGPIELPFMGGQVWEVIQQFAVRGSHASDSAFSWDFVHVPDDHPRGQPRGYGVQSDNIKFIAGAEGTVIRSDGTHPTSTTDATPNIIDVRRGPDEILSYLHMKTGSGVVAVNDPVTKGQRLGIVSNVGGGTPHLHFAVITRIDNAYVTRPAYFVSYCLSKDFGQTWTFVAAGMPTNGEWVKRANEQLPAC